MSADPAFVVEPIYVKKAPGVTNEDVRKANQEYAEKLANFLAQKGEYNKAGATVGQFAELLRMRLLYGIGVPLVPWPPEEHEPQDFSFEQLVREEDPDK